METILEGQNISAAAAGTLLADRSAEGTAPGSSVGWLAIARPVTLEIWLESRTSGGSRGLNVANETELDGRVLALAACPRRKSCVEGWRHVVFKVMLGRIFVSIGCFARLLSKMNLARIYVVLR